MRNFNYLQGYFLYKSYIFKPIRGFSIEILVELTEFALLTKWEICLQS